MSAPTPSTIARGVGRYLYPPRFWYYWVHSPKACFGAFGSRRAAFRALRRWERWADIEPLDG